jgi:cytochrome c oxidase assembly protein subunit 15
MIPSPNSRLRIVRIWLYGIAALVILMVMVGGATRLTDSGLSIVEWRPVTGTLPPVTHADWLIEFEKYKTSPEYELVNKGMTLAEFKRIYWWEWGHRLLGRLIGLVFLLPLLFFHARGWIGPKLRWPLWGIFALGGAQGAIGWWMVASGLVNRVDVAHERLAVHLTMAALILVAIVWTAQSIAPARPVSAPPRRLVVVAAGILLLIVVQIALGGLVAGLKAGYVYDTWPLIDGAFIPAGERLFYLDPPWLNFFDNHLTVQFMHRMTGYLLVMLMLVHAVDASGAGGKSVRLGAVMLAIAGVGQAALGIATLVWNVPVTLALAHQLAAMLLLVLATLHVQGLRGSREDLIRLHLPKDPLHADRLRAA